MISETVYLYFNKVRHINNELNRLYKVYPVLTDSIVYPILSDLKKKYNFPDFEINSIRFVPTRFAFDNEEWNLFKDKFPPFPYSIN